MPERSPDGDSWSSYGIAIGWLVSARVRRINRGRAGYAKGVVAVSRRVVEIIVLLIAGALIVASWPIGLLVLAPALLVGGISARRSSQDPGVRAVAVGAITAGIVSLLLVVGFGAVIAFGMSFRSASGVTQGAPPMPIIIASPSPSNP